MGVSNTKNFMLIQNSVIHWQLKKKNKEKKVQNRKIKNLHSIFPLAFPITFLSSFRRIWNQHKTLRFLIPHPNVYEIFLWFLVLQISNAYAQKMDHFKHFSESKNLLLAEYLSVPFKSYLVLKIEGPYSIVYYFL